MNKCKKKKILRNVYKYKKYIKILAYKDFSI